MKHWAGRSGGVRVAGTEDHPDRNKSSAAPKPVHPPKAIPVTAAEPHHCPPDVNLFSPAGEPSGCKKHLPTPLDGGGFPSALYPEITIIHP